MKIRTKTAHLESNKACFRHDLYLADVDAN